MGRSDAAVPRQPLPVRLGPRLSGRTAQDPGVMTALRAPLAFRAMRPDEDGRRR
ncbi:MAG: hypothetical protein HKM94_09355 [Halobacteria archaeon]|nr:hypothetical protein [Halobacteria archaeon]